MRIVLTLVALSVLGCEQPDPKTTTAVTTGMEQDLLCEIGIVDGGARSGSIRRSRFESPCACPGLGPEDCGYAEWDGDRRRSLFLEEEERTVLARTGPDARLRFSAHSISEGSLTVVFTDPNGEQQSEIVTLERKWADIEIALGGSGEAELAFRAKGRVALAQPRVVRKKAGSEENVIVYLSDTLRADHTTPYGYDRDTTPFLSELSETGFVYTNSYSTAAWTRPSSASVLTGYYPSFHQANARRRLPEEVVTLAERFKAAGWSTWAFVANGNVHAKGLGFEQGFDRFVVVNGDHQSPANADKAHRLARSWLKRNRGERFFLYIHTIDPHAPYAPPKEYEKLFADPAYQGWITPETSRHKAVFRTSEFAPPDIERLVAFYDAEIRYMDDSLRDFWAFLERKGLSAKSYFFFTSDHGEEFSDHDGWGHGRSLYEELIKVPLIMRPPTTAKLRLPVGTAVEAPAQSVDIATTLVDLFDLPGPDDLQGLVLSPLTAKVRDDRAIYCEEIRNDVDLDLFSLTVEGQKIITKKKRDRDRNSKFAFDLISDPHERTDQYRERRLRGSLAASFRRLATFSTKELSGTPAPERLEPEPSEEEQRHLRALGYIE